MLVSGEKYREIFKNNLEALARDKRYIGKFWLEIFNRMSHHGVPINTFEIDGKSHWLEVDFHGDLTEVVNNLIQRKMSKLSKRDEDLLTQKISQLNNPKIDEILAKKIISTLPKTPEDLNSLTINMPFSEEESLVINNIIKNHLGNINT